MNAHPRSTFAAAGQRGAALVVGLILLLVLTVLAVSGMNTATLELQMAGNMQYTANAFHSAERGIDVALKRPTPPPGDPVEVPDEAVDADNPNDTLAYTIENNTNPGIGMSPVPDGGSEMGGGSGVAAWHYEITSTGRSSRNTVSVHTQSYYRKGGNNPASTF